MHFISSRCQAKMAGLDMVLFIQSLENKPQIYNSKHPEYINQRKKKLQELADEFNITVRPEILYNIIIFICYQQKYIHTTYVHYCLYLQIIHFNNTFILNNNTLILNK